MGPIKTFGKHVFPTHKQQRFQLSRSNRDTPVLCALYQYFRAKWFHDLKDPERKLGLFMLTTQLI